VVFGGSGTDRIKGFTTIPAYSAAKTALGSFVKSTAKTIAGEHKAARSGDSLRLGVTINAVCPDYVATEYLTAAQVERYSPSMPLRRLIDPDEVARLVLFLTRPEAASINGQLISVDQGKQR
jgi:NAD(P)-dependent dehydrogenase (short-subunit alcohol dehydrogenase family)